MMRFAVGLVAGMALIQQLPALPPLWLLWPPGLLAPVFMRRGLPLLAAVLLGWCWAGLFAAHRLAEAWPAASGRQTVLAEGQVLDIPNPMQRGVRFDFRIDRTLDSAAGRMPLKVRISWYDAGQAVKAGEHWRLRLSLRPPRGMLNPGGFDYEQWLFAQNIRAVGYVRDSADNRKLPDEPGMAGWLPVWRQATHDRLDQALAGRPMAGLLKALTMGVEAEISSSQWEVLRKTGTAHLIAISGSHIGLVAGFIFVLTRYLCAGLGMMFWSPPRMAALAGLAAALLYSALANFAIPTQRALIMIAVAMGAVLLQRHQRVMRVMALALTAVVLWDPLAVLAPGFWLSFGAVALIAYGVSGRLATTGHARLLWRINWVTALGLAPLLLLFFGQVSLVSPLANLLAVPVLGTLLIPLCLSATLLLSLMPPLGQWLLGVAAAILSQAWSVLEWLAAWPWSQWTKADPPLWAIPFAVLGVLLLLAPRGIPARWLGAVCLLPALLHHPGRPQAGAFRFALLDVGQGLSAVVETRRYALVFDTGARLSPNYDMGSAVVEPYLRHRGIARIDTLVVSHGDNDHIGGAASLLRAFPVTAVYTSVPEKLQGATALDCHAGQQWEWDEVRFTMLGQVTPGEKENDNSCVLHVSGAGGSVLLTGDIEAAGERHLLAAQRDRLSSDILVAPHHGSKTSSTSAFLDAVAPRLVLIPAGYLNRFGFPHPSVMARYQAADIPVMTTGAAGAITLDVTPGSGPSPPRSWREDDRRYWRVP